MLQKFLERNLFPYMYIIMRTEKMSHVYLPNTQSLWTIYNYTVQSKPTIETMSYALT